MGVWGAEWQSQFSSEMSFAPGEEKTPAEKQRSSVLEDFLLPDAVMCHRIYIQCVTRRGDSCGCDMFYTVDTMQRINYMSEEMIPLYVVYMTVMETLDSDYLQGMRQFQCSSDAPLSSYVKYSKVNLVFHSQKQYLIALLVCGTGCINHISSQYV